MRSETEDRGGGCVLSDDPIVASNHGSRVEMGVKR